MNSYVIPCSKRAGSYYIQIPTVWSDKPLQKEYFSSSRYKNPERAAQQQVKALLARIYGDRRALLIHSNPQWVQKLKYGCQVSVRESRLHSRGKTYDAFDLSWTEFSCNEHGKWSSKRKRTSRMFNAVNKVEIAHKVSLFMAEIRAETTASILHESALNFEYDLSESAHPES